MTQEQTVKNAQIARDPLDAIEAEVRALGAELSGLHEERRNRDWINVADMPYDDRCKMGADDAMLGAKTQAVALKLAEAQKRYAHEAARLTQVVIRDTK